MHATKVRFRVSRRIRKSSYRDTERIGNIVPGSLPSRDDSLGKRRCMARVCITAVVQYVKECIMPIGYMPRVA